MTGCPPSEGESYGRLIHKVENVSIIEQMATDYYTEKGYYPLSLVQLEAYVLSKEDKYNAGTSHEANNVLGIINPYNQGVGYGEAYADAWYFKMAVRDYDYLVFPHCDRVILYHPAYDRQGFILFDYADVFCYEGKCREGTPFEYDLKTKAVHVDKALFRFL